MKWSTYQSCSTFEEAKALAKANPYRPITRNPAGVGWAVWGIGEGQYSPPLPPHKEESKSASNKTAEDLEAAIRKDEEKAFAELDAIGTNDIRQKEEQDEAEEKYKSDLMASIKFDFPGLSEEEQAKLLTEILSERDDIRSEIQAEGGDEMADIPQKWGLDIKWGWDD